MHYINDKACYGWLKIAVRGAIDRLRSLDFRMAKETERIDSQVVNRVFDGEEPDGTTNAEEKGEQAAALVVLIKELLHSFPSGYRTILSLYLFEGYDFEEIAEITKLKPASVRSAYSRGRRNFRKKYSIMDSLQAFIQENKELFEQEPLPDGHEIRFAERLKKRKQRKSKVLIYSSVAASLLLMITVAIHLSKPCLTGSGSCYYQQITRLSDQIERSTRDLPEYRRREILLTVASILPYSKEEFSEMLPSEVNSKDAKRLNKEYYQQLYEGMKEIATLTK